MGRPTKCTPEVTAVIVEAVKRGHYFEVAARLGGICEKTFYNWLEAGEADTEPYAGFLQAIKGAEAESEDQALKTVRFGNADKAAPPMWQSAMTFLERRYPQRWGRRDPDHGLKTKLLEAELDTLKAKLKMLEQGKNPDDNSITVIMPNVGKER